MQQSRIVNFVGQRRKRLRSLEKKVRKKDVTGVGVGSGIGLESVEAGMGVGVGVGVEIVVGKGVEMGALVGWVEGKVLTGVGLASLVVVSVESKVPAES